jgi:Carboxypeptidase regulatory-like domain/TonB dependent receptor
MVHNFSWNRTVERMYSVIALLALLCICAQSYGQVSGATLSGTLTDSSHAAIPHAQVEIQNVATGVKRTVTTDGAGFYAAPNLLPGHYKVTAMSPGFEKTVDTTVELAVGAQQTLNMQMSLGKVTETVVVTTDTAGIQSNSSTLSAVVDSKTVKELPLNGRDWTQLATLEPGVTAVTAQATTSSATTNRGNRGYGNQLTDSGHSPYENNYRVNGVSTNDYTNGSPGSVIGVNLGVDAIQEFSVLTTDYTAEYGRASGAIINAITMSGTNQFHGSAYGFLRNAALDAKNYFDQATQPIPPFHRYQVGAAAGGPIIRNKTFIFGDYEGIFQDLSATFTNHVPSSAARNGTLCSIPIASGPSACKTTQVAVSPAIQPYFPLWPVGNGALSANGDTQVFTYPALAHLTENYATARIDHHLSDSDSLAASWFYDHGPESVPVSLGTVLEEQLSSRQMYSLEETHIFSDKLVNTARIGFSRVSAGVNLSKGALAPIASDTTLGSLPGRYAPAISVPGLTATSSLDSATSNNHLLNSFQYYDDVFLTRGTHALKLGVAMEHMQYDYSTLQAFDGNFAFGSFQSFLADTPTSITIQGPNASEIGTRQTLYGIYLQDDWRVRQNFTLNLGIRYEPTNLPTESHNRYEVLSSLTAPLPTSVHTLWSDNATLRDFAPRVGLSWVPLHNGKTVIHAGFGMFDVLPINWVYTTSKGSSAPFIILQSAENLQPGDFPTVTSTPIGSSNIRYSYVQPNPHRSYTLNSNFNVQQQLSPNLVVTVGYVGTRGIHLPDTPDNMNFSLPTATSSGYMWPCAPKDANGNCTQAGSLLNPNVGEISSTLWDHSSTYNGLQVGVTKRLSYGFQFQGSYNWGKCIDTGSNMNRSDPFSNSLTDYMYFDHRLTRGLCDFNITQSGVVSAIWTIPSVKRESRLTSSLLKGWQLGGILKVQSGTPFSLVLAGDPLHRNAGDSGVDQPDRLPNCKAIAGGVAAYVNINCFTPASAPVSLAALCNTAQFSGAQTPAPTGRVYCGNLFGDAGRNALSGPGLLDLDASLFKNIPIRRISDAFNLQLRAEFFNVLNHPNFLPPLDNETLFNANGSAVSQAGAIDATSTDPRQIQFGVRGVW